MIPIRRLVGRSVLCGITALTMAGCGKPREVVAEGKESSKAATQVQPNPAGVVVLGPDAPELRRMTIESVRTVPLPADEVTAPAKIEANPNRVGHAVLPMPGRIVRVMVKLGDSVTQGQPVIVIESPAVGEAEAAYVQAEASVRQAELAVTKADADLARLTDLFEHQAVAQKEVLAAQTTSAIVKTSLEQAQSAREQTRRRLELLGLKAGHLQQQVTVTAPVSGKVLEVSVVDGEFRNEISTPLITITDLSRVWATSEVPESKIRYYKLGGTADLELIAYPNEVFRARVTRIADTVNSETRTIKVSAELDNSAGRLRPEMFGRLRYADGFVRSLWVPDSAVVLVGDKDFVFLEQGPGRFLASPVELGQRHDGGFAVTKGLKAGDRVVTQGSVYLKAAL
ncbi:MAG: efflux RND transporter periplasmic adaptor subunit [Acidobacteria bacterium]|nr:efflux RND transporter periplasmic adaptor subunit [Acidobacteriota bacterium]